MAIIHQRPSVIINHSASLNTGSFVTCNFFKPRVLNVYLQRKMEGPFERVYRMNLQKLDTRSLCSKFIKATFYFVDVLYLVHTLFVRAYKNPIVQG